MKILVTGSAGYIGSVLVKNIDLEEHEVRAIDKNISKKANLNNVDQVDGDLSDKNLVDKICENVDCILHLAGEANVRSGKTDLQKNNSVASDLLIKSALLHGVKKFIYLSTVKSGLSNDYARSKESVEKSLIANTENMEMVFTIIQSAAVYGRGMKNGLAKWIRMYKYNYFPRLPNSYSQLEMISVSDLSKIILKCIESSQTDNKIIKVSDCQVYTINEIDQASMEKMGRKNKGYKAPKILLHFLAFIGSGLNKFGINMFYNLDTHRQLFYGIAEADRKVFDMLDYYPQQTFYTQLDEILFSRI